MSALLHTSEEQGYQLLHAHVPVFSTVARERLVHLLKKEADRRWNYEAQLSFKLAGYVLCIGDISQSTAFHALGLMMRGDALRRMDYDQEALPFLDAAGDEFLAHGDDLSWARTRIGRVSVCLRLNRPTEALHDAARAREIFMRHRKFLRAGQIDVNAALIYYELGQYEQALQLFDRAIEAYLLHGEGVERPIARARGNKALTLAAQGKFREATVLHEQARDVFAAYGEREEISVAREELNIADIAAAQGHYSQALLLYMRSRDLFDQHNMTFAAAEVAQQMCLCLMRLNRTNEAADLAETTARFFRDSPGQGHNLARSLMHQAAAATLHGDYHKAHELLREASDLLDGGGFVRLAALARLRRAELYFATGQLPASLHAARDSADIFADQEDLPHLAWATLLQAHIAEASSDYATARALCEQALDIALGQGLLELQYHCYDVLGHLAEYANETEAAAAYYERAMQSIDEVQSRLVLDERTTFLEDKATLYQRAMLLAFKHGREEQALSYVEKAKSRVLGDYLRNTIDIRVRAGDSAGEAMLEDLERLREEQSWFSSIVYETENEAKLSDTAIMRRRAIGSARARTEMQKRERGIEQLLEKIQLQSVGNLVTRPRANEVGPTPSQLERGSCLLEYYMAGQDLYIFTLTSPSMNVRVVKGAVSQLERLLTLWRANLDMAALLAGEARPEQSFPGLHENGLGLLQRLHALLIGPVSDLLAGCDHFIIVPYGCLHYLPFHCLFDGVQFLIERVQLSYLPAASLLDICRRRGQRMRAQNIPLDGALVMGLSDGGRLPFAVREAQAVARQLGATCVLNEAATTALLWQTSAQRPVVHIAAHGLFRLDAPNFSHIHLADRQLSAIEVFNLDLSLCSLVTLSACETGRAVIGGVDEVIGLGRGFLYAGAASLLPSLWKVDDASSAALMTVFYQSIALGHAKSLALAHAQRAFLKRARTARSPYRVHPYFWAAFQLIGDAGPLITSKRS